MVTDFPKHIFHSMIYILKNKEARLHKLAAFTYPLLWKQITVKKCKSWLLLTYIENLKVKIHCQFS